MEGSSSQSHPAGLSEDPVNDEDTTDDNNVLTIRQTDDQEMGLAVAILELIGSQPHVQVTETQNLQSSAVEDANSEKVQVLEISQNPSQDLGVDIQNQGPNIVSVTGISESQREAIHALETLVQIGHTGQHPVMIQFQPAEAGEGDNQSNLDPASIQQEDSRMSNQGSTINNTVSLDSSGTIVAPKPQKRVALPPVMHTTTSPRTRMKARREVADKQTNNKDADSTSPSATTAIPDSPESPVPSESEDAGNEKTTAECSSPRTRQRIKKEKEDGNMDKTNENKSPRKRKSVSTGTKKVGGTRTKRHKPQISDETQNEDPDCNQASPNTPVQPKKVKNIRMVCPVCEAPFTRKDNLKTHMRRQHQAELQDKGTNKLTCFHPECGISIYHTSKMIEHMEKEHGLVYQKEELEFESFEEFKRWKAEEEASKFVQFTSSSKDKLTGEGIKSLYYKCQRDGSTQPHRKKGAPSRLTTRKSLKGSVKSNIWCPARINARWNTTTDHITALYIQSHSHPISIEDTKHQRLPDLLRKEILAKFARGHSIDEIYNDLHKPRDMDNNATPLINKQHLVSRRILYMLQAGVTRSRKLHDDEKTSVRLLVDKLQAKDFNPVLMYKAAGESILEGSVTASYVQHMNHVREDAFILALQTKEQLMLLEKHGSKMLCVDATHTTNSCGVQIQLLSLFVTDDYQNSYPVAYLLTNHLDDHVFEGFVMAVKSRCPALSPTLIVTDEDNTGDAQFTTVYPNLHIKQLLSKWHIHLAWLKQLKHHVSSVALRQEMYHCLMLLLEEKSTKKFEYMLNAFLSHYTLKCQIFTDYFQVTYASRPKTWASCYLTPTSRNDTCIFQNDFHEKIKTFFTQKRKSNKRVDFLANILLEIAKNDSWCRDTQEFKELPKDAAGTQFVTNHERGEDIPSENIVEEGLPDQQWKVTAGASTKESHLVKKLKEVCDDASLCYSKCLELPCFSLCRHLYSCSCVEEAQLCPHIHAVHMLRVSQVMFSVEHMQGGADNMAFGCLETEIDDDDGDGEISGEDAIQIEELKHQYEQMLGLLKYGRVRQLLLPHVHGTVCDLLATCEAVKAGAVTVTYEQPADQPSAEQQVAVPQATEQQAVVQQAAANDGDPNQIIAIPIDAQPQSQLG